MSFQPVIPASGLVGWRFLQRTHAAQMQAFTATGLQEREAGYFLEKIGQITNASELVADRRLLSIALGGRSDCRTTSKTAPSFSASCRTARPALPPLPTR
ncbi:hypothetical protein ACFOHS_12495 [Jhaorihella thermophila]